MSIEEGFLGAGSFFFSSSSNSSPSRVEGYLVRGGPLEPIEAKDLAGEDLAGETSVTRRVTFVTDFLDFFFGGISGAKASGGIFVARTSSVEVS